MVVIVPKDYSHFVAEESKILSDVLAKTGVRLSRIQNAPAEAGIEIERLLDVLLGWKTFASPPIRRAMTFAFVSPHAYSRFGDLLLWWAEEDDLLTRKLLTQVVAKLMKPADAQRVWSIRSTVPYDPFLVFVDQKLAKDRKLGSSVRDSLVQRLQNGELGGGELGVVSKVGDPRIKAWFLERIEDPDPDVRRIARRLMQKPTSKLDPRVRFVKSGPVRPGELFSTEVDDERLEAALRDVSERFGVTMPASVNLAELAESIPPGSWLRCDLGSIGEWEFLVWLRKEDEDIVEIVLTKQREKMQRAT